MPQYLDENGNPIAAPAPAVAAGAGHIYLDDNGNPIGSGTGQGQPHAVGGNLRPLTQRERFDMSYPMGRPGESLLENVKAGANNVGGGIWDVAKAVAHPIDTLKSLVTGNPVKDIYEGLNTSPGETITRGAGQAIATAGLPDVAEGLGGAMKRAGAKVGDITLGANALDKEYGARPGAGISENRVVAMTRPSLTSKVRAKIPQVTGERDAILARNSTPVDITGAVSKPFDDLRAKVTNPRTGVAAPSEIKNLFDTQAAAMVEQNPATGRPTVYTPGQPPAFRNLTDLTPSEIAEYNSNLRGMADYTAKDSPLANQALKMAGHNLRTKMLEAAPEAEGAVNKLHNTQAAEDILSRQMTEGSRYNPTTETLTGAVMRRIGDPLLVTGGTSLASLLDLAGSGVQAGAKLLRPGGGNSAAASTAPGHGPTPSSITLNPSSVAPGSASAAAGTRGYHQFALPGEPGFLPSPLGIPDVAGPTQPPPSPPPNVSLTERVGASALPARPGQPNIQTGTGGLEGPPTMVTTRPRNKFGPKVAAPAFTIPKKQLSSKVKEK